MQPTHRNNYWLIVLLFASCKTSLQGDINPNLAPETFAVVDTIIRTAEDRFTSQVEITWWGNDADGYVTGYEYSLDSVINESTVWHFTTVQDSIFLLPVPAGMDTVDFPFWIRAIDNFGLKDESPAHLFYPVKNSPPSVVFLYTENNPLKSFPVLRFYWQGSDPDGKENIKRYELCWNDTSQIPVQLAATSTGAVFEATDLQTTHPDCRVYVNNNSVAEAGLISGLVLNDSDALYIRAIDNAERASPYAASTKVFVKKPVSDILMVDGYTSGGASVETFYSQHLNAVGFSEADTMQLFEKVNGEYSQQSADNISQSKVFALFKTIIWFTNDASNSLSIGQRSLNDFFDQGGKLLMAVYVSSLFDEQSSFLDFTPIESLVVPTDTTLLLTDTSKIVSQAYGFPDLKSTAFVGTVRPFVPVVGATILYNGELIAKDDITLLFSNWNGISTVIAKKENPYGETNFIISTLELHKLDGFGNMDSFFNQVMHTEFGL